MLSDEQLVERFQSGDRDALSQLWEQVRWLVWKYANRWAVYGGDGVEVDDLMQAGFIAVLRAAETFNDTGRAKFTTFLYPVLKTEFSIATGQRTRKRQMDPLQSALSLDAPLTDDSEDFTLSDTLPDPAAEEAFEAVEEADRLERIRVVLEEAIGNLAPGQQEVIRKRYYRQEPLARGNESNKHSKALAKLRHPAVSRQLVELMR